MISLLIWGEILFNRKRISSDSCCIVYSWLFIAWWSAQFFIRGPNFSIATELFYLSNSLYYLFTIHVLLHFGRNQLWFMLYCSCLVICSLVLGTLFDYFGIAAELFYLDVSLREGFKENSWNFPIKGNEKIKITTRL